MAQVYPPKVFAALAECLRTIYWFTNDLKSFMIQCGVPPQRVSSLDWRYKRTAANELVNELAAQGAAATPLVKAIIAAVIEQDYDFPRLAKLTADKAGKDGKAAVADARLSVRQLRDAIGDQASVDLADLARQTRKTEAERRRKEAQTRASDLAALKQAFLKLAALDDSQAQKRGIDFQTWLRQLFGFHDLDPRGSFASTGEQIDGSIRVEGWSLLVEARWTTALVAPVGVRDFVGKLDGKLDNTIGLMVSINGFTEAASATATQGGRLLAIFLDGTDLYPVLDGHHDLKDLLLRKIRHASDTGAPMYRMGT